MMNNDTKKHILPGGVDPLFLFVRSPKKVFTSLIATEFYQFSTGFLPNFLPTYILINK